MRRGITYVKGLLWMMATLGCQTSQPPEPISEATLPIVGGTVATTCQWSSVVMMIGPAVCTGTLVHPRAVVTAKHCLMDESETNLRLPVSVGFGESRGQWARTVNISNCYVHPSNDIGLCVLAEDVTDVPIVPVMAACETSELLPGRPIVEVGFGVIGAHSRNYGNKKWINGTIESRSASLADILVTTGTQDGEYFGDSGGPLFFRMPSDHTWRLIGEDCCSDDISDAGPRISTYTSVPYHVDWMEEQSGLDLTPCHDPGGWKPDGQCVGFPLSPDTGSGTWTTQCQAGLTVRAQTCEASTYDAGIKSDAGETGDAPPEAGDSSPRDGTVGDSSRDAPIPDGVSSDGLDGRADVFDGDGFSVGWDARISVADAREPFDSALAFDVAPVPGDTRPGDTAGPSPDARANDTRVDPVDSADTTHPDATRTSDGANDGQALTRKSAGCSCRIGARPIKEGTGLLCFGLALVAGRVWRRRRPR